MACSPKSRALANGRPWTGVWGCEWEPVGAMEKWRHEAAKNVTILQRSKHILRSLSLESMEIKYGKRNKKT